ncbi:MAG: aconitate hydratase, partial [Desulfotomaculaceae bacterium]
SSREHAVLVPMSIGMKLVVALSFARIYRQNLINCGVVPLTFLKPEDYSQISETDILVISNAVQQIKCGEVVVHNKTKDVFLTTKCNLSDRETSVLLSGGLLNYVKNKPQIK